MKRAFRATAYLAWGNSILLLYGLLGCASKHHSMNSSLVLNHQDEEIAMLQSKLEDKQREIDRLTARLELLEFQGRSEMKGCVRPLPQVKLVPQRNEMNDPLRSNVNGQGTTLADSTHEVLSWYLNGLTFMDQGEYEAAVDYFSKFLNQAPNHVYADRAYYWLGEAYAWMGNLPAALIALNKLEIEFPESLRRMDGAIRKATLLRELGRSQEAVSLLRGLIRKYPSHPGASKVLATLARFERLQKKEGLNP